MIELPIKLDPEGLLSNLRREGTPGRTYYMELFIDQGIGDAVCDRFGILRGLDGGDPCFQCRRETALCRFLGYEGANFFTPGFDFPRTNETRARYTAGLEREGGRTWTDESRGEISS